MLGDLDLVHPEALHRHAEDVRPGEDGGGAVGVQALDLAPLGLGHRAEHRGDLPAATEADAVAVDAGRVVLLEPEVDRCHPGGRAGNGNHGLGLLADLFGNGALDRGAGLVVELVELRPGRRVRVQVALALANDAELGRDVEVDGAPAADDQLGRAAADIEHAGRAAVVPVAVAGRPEETEPRLVVALDYAGLDGEAVGDHRRELLAVGGVPAGAGHHANPPVHVADRVDLPRVGLKHVVDAVHGIPGEQARGVDARGKPRDLAPARQFGHLPVV